MARSPEPLPLCFPGELGIAHVGGGTKGMHSILRMLLQVSCPRRLGDSQKPHPVTMEPQNPSVAGRHLPGTLRMQGFPTARFKRQDLLTLETMVVMEEVFKVICEALLRKRNFSQSNSADLNGF